MRGRRGEGNESTYEKETEKDGEAFGSRAVMLTIQCNLLSLDFLDEYFGVPNPLLLLVSLIDVDLSLKFHLSQSPPKAPKGT